MKLTKDHVKGRIILDLQESEYLVVLAALKAATADDSRRGLDYVAFYGAEKAELVSLHNRIDEAERTQ